MQAKPLAVLALAGLALAGLAFSNPKGPLDPGGTALARSGSMGRRSRSATAGRGPTSWRIP
jgi:hypothetical protein